MRPQLLIIAAWIALAGAGVLVGCDGAAGPGAAGPGLVSTASGEIPPGPAPGRSFHFVDVAAELGLTRALLAGRPGKDHLLDSAGAGAAFLDYDRDGRLDVFLVNGWRLEGSKVVEKGKDALYRGSAGGPFLDVTDSLRAGGEGQWGWGVAAADQNGDGWTDLLITSFGPTVLYRNREGKGFEDVAGRLGIEAPGWNTGAALLDADGDGDLDLYVASYIACSLEDVLAAERTLDWHGVEKVAFGPFGLTGAPDHYFEAEGPDHYVDATVRAGLEDRALGFGFSVRAFDADDDGDTDLYVANDSDPNYLYRNEGGGSFREVGVWTGCAFDSNGAAQAGMGLTVGDVNGDLRSDIFVTNFAEDASTLYLAGDGGIYEDVTRAWGLHDPTYLPLSWGTALADLDNDGDLDVVIANGHIYPQVDAHPEHKQTFAQRCLLLENAGGRFEDRSAAAGPGFALARSWRGIAVGDYDNDGDLDLLLTALDSPPTLLRNDSKGGAWLTVLLEDERGPIAPIGTRVLVTAGGRQQSRDIAAGDSYGSTHDPRSHFGLGDAQKAEKVEVRWPGGARTVLEDVPARQFVRVKRP